MSLVIICSVSYKANSSELEYLLGENGENIPEGFSELFKKRDGLITVKMYSESVKLNGSSVYRTVKLDDSSSLQLQYFLLSNGVSKDLVKKISEDLVDGADSSIACEGLIADCALYPDEYGFVYDDNTRVLKIFINENFIHGNDGIKYYDPKKDKLSLVNNSDVYASFSSGGNNVQWRNETYISLLYGYVESDYQINYTNENDTEFDMYHTNYVADFPRFSVEFGYDKADRIDNNSRTLLIGKSSDNYHLSLFSNDRLSSDSNQNNNYMSLFAQQRTELEIYRDGYLIARKTLRQGVNNISYSTFDVGAYDVELRYVVAGKLIKKENRYIYNMPGFDMSLDQVDWYSRIGQYDSDIYGNYSYVSVGAVSRLLENSILGFGYENVGSNSSITGYIESTYLNDINTMFLASADHHGSYFVNTKMRVYNLTVNAEKLVVENDKFGSSFNSIQHTQVGVTYPFEFGGIYFSLNYMYYKGTDESINSYFESDNLYLNGSYSFDHFNVSASVFYDKNRNENLDSWSFGLNIRVPLNDLFDISSSFYTDAKSSDLRNSISYDSYLNKSTNVYSEVSLIDSLKESSVSGQFGFNNKNRYFNSKSSVFFNSEDDISANFNINSSQIVDSKTIKITNVKSKSYAVVNNYNRANSESAMLLGHLEIQNIKNDQTRIVKLVNDEQILPLEGYNKYDFKVNTDGGQFYSENKNSHELFSTPGSFVNIINNVSPINKYISAFLTENGEVISNLECVGDGCNYIEEITDGVFRISVFEDFDFLLKAEDRSCFIEIASNSNHVINLGKSICIKDEMLAKIANEFPEYSKIYYQGSISRPDINYDKDVKYVKYGDNYAMFTSGNGYSEPKIRNGFITYPRLVNREITDSKNLAHKVLND